PYQRHGNAVLKKDTKMPKKNCQPPRDYAPPQKWRLLATGHHWPHFFRENAASQS
uniref:Uncharacterized protein n=1 Tax=Aegilops tauschii subsp. strangulata TaxID=200361 RepID=A0A453JYZ7_AEGTS